MSQIQELKFLELKELEPNPDQPRIDFQKDKLEELSESIKSIGIVQPLIVRKKGKKYEIIAGERRWRAAKLAGLERLPAVVKNVSSDKVLLESFIENIQREDLTTIEKENAVWELWTLKNDGTRSRFRELDGNNGGRPNEKTTKSLSGFWEYSSTFNLAKVLGYTEPWVYAIIEAKIFRDKNPEINKLRTERDEVIPTTMLQVTEGLDDKTRLQVLKNAVSQDNPRSSQGQLRDTVNVLKTAPEPLKKAFQKGEIELEQAKRAVKIYSDIGKENIKPEKIERYVEELKKRRQIKNSQEQLEQKLDRDILSGKRDSSGIILQNEAQLLVDRIEGITSDFRSIGFSQIRQMGEKNWKHARTYVRAIRDHADKLLGYSVD